MDLNQLREIGGLVSLTPVTKEITWSPPGSEDDVTFTVRIRKLSCGVVEHAFAGDMADRSYMASVIKECLLLGEDGKERLSYEDAYQLEPTLAQAFMKAINEVNEVGKSGASKN